MNSVEEESYIPQCMPHGSCIRAGQVNSVAGESFIVSHCISSIREVQISNAGI